jgi:hypothetical protein
MPKKNATIPLPLVDDEPAAYCNIFISLLQYRGQACVIKEKRDKWKR